MEKARKQFVERLQETPVIPGVKSRVDLKMAVDQGAQIIFILTGSIFSLREAVQYNQEHNGPDRALLFAHIDLLTGIGKDNEGLRYLASEIGINGILTTRSALIKAGKKEGLITILRVFAVDSEALKTGLETVHSAAPDALEILPALVIPAIAHRLPFDRLPPVIAGGLLENQEMVRTILKTPVVAVSASRPSVWKQPVKGRRRRPVPPDQSMPPGHTPPSRSPATPVTSATPATPATPTARPPRDATALDKW
ncbi:MAG TPA: glycerol-3-phosphate responsive antiterminator [Firmicutes bacterium]|nr:glycerol-3-phosphate responsive antiterminator [Bacillota bacterium]